MEQRLLFELQRAIVRKLIISLSKMRRMKYKTRDSKVQSSKFK